MAGSAPDIESTTGFLTREPGRVFMTGTQALGRLPLVQRWRDRRDGHDTAGFISGYRGSPLGGYDRLLWTAKQHLADHEIHFQPAINEELAATAILGSQQTGLYGDAKQDGVFAIWYGKGPGLDRASDALKHANSMGASPLGGALVVVGDDHGAVSSSLAHQSEQLMMSWGMPVLNPADVREYLEFGLFGLALSRFSGCYAGFLAVSETVESAAGMAVDWQEPAFATPDDVTPPPGGLHIRWPFPQLAQEELLYRHRLPAATAFARANRIDRVEVDSPRARLGIVATGKAWNDLRQALQDLGIDDRAAAELGLRLYKVGMSWPLEPEGIRRFADGLDEILVIEEKRPVIESQLKEILYHLDAVRRPRVYGKTDPDGRKLLSEIGTLTPDQLAPVLNARIPAGEGGDVRRAHLEFLAAKGRERQAREVIVRPPHFCAGCPHNSSTRVPDGSRAFAGTGCHLMVAWMDRDTTSFVQMGGDGANWVGQAPFTDTPHVFQNLGDGTYEHSGSLSIRQAVAAGVNITFKLLYNDAVAMTGGQPLDSPFSVPQITQQLHHEGVAAIALVSDDPDKHRGRTGLAPGVTVHHRRDLDAVQRRLRETPGVTVLVYDQPCATNLKRRGKRGEVVGARPRAVIDPLVCEGCGDCSLQSNCLALRSVDTAYGRKRAIDRSACVGDLACLDARCPAIVSIEGGNAPARPAFEYPFPLPDPPEPKPLVQAHGVLVAGVGGSGVVTVGQVIGLAAHIAGLSSSVLDFTGLAQRGGGVLTHVRIGPDDASLAGVRLGTGGADLVLASDLVTAASPDAVSKLRKGVTTVIADSDLSQTAASLTDPGGGWDKDHLEGLLYEAVGVDGFDGGPGKTLAETLFGDALYANMLLLGLAYQRGHLPIPLAAIEAAIRQHGVAVEANLEALNWGRLAAVDSAAVRRATGLPPPGADGLPEPDLTELIDDRTRYLTDYQGPALARRYRDLVDRADAAERQAGVVDSGFSRAVATQYFRLLAVKDEYEVARLLTRSEFLDEIGTSAGDGRRIRFHLSPPLPFRDRQTDDGRARKLTYGPWILPWLRLLAGARTLRGTWLDPLRFTEDARAATKMRADYEAMIETLLPTLDTDYDLARALAALPEIVRGFGPVRAATTQDMLARRTELEAQAAQPLKQDVA